ncbi:MAG: pyruvate synthase subunit beta [Deltaproteobacteria bacterium]|nr:pyruvate synthase subunit beta [Deltaproteobacteria bacterium]
MSSDSRQPRLPAPELLISGHSACQGCGASVAMRLALKALGEQTIVVLPACCWSIIAGAFPYTSLRVPVIHSAFEAAGAVASGVRAALDITGQKNVQVLGWSGDGGTFDIGLQSLSGAVERNENVLFVCYDNEGYMNTGIQRSSATPQYAWTTTTPEKYPKETPKKNMADIMAAHKIPYAATTSVAFPDDLIFKFKKAARIQGSRFIHILSPCPPGWRIPSDQSIKVTRMATQCNVFPIYEIEAGDNYYINIEPEGVPVRDYLKAQGRFSHLSAEAIEQIQRRVDFEWERLLHKAMMKRFGE